MSDSLMDDPRFLELLKQSGGHFGIARDDYFAEKIPKEERCDECGGTGNEFFSMYRKCRKCKGTGRPK